MRLHKISKNALVLFLAAACLSTCALFEPIPEQITLQDRVEQLPLNNLSIEAPVQIYWDTHGIPYIDAENNDDLFFAVGMTQAHLRLTQMEIMRRISQGRISEMAGPFTDDIDTALRILDFGKAADKILEAMPPESKRFLGRFVEGINTYIERLDKPPLDFRLLGLEKEAWTPRDVITLSRLFGAEVNWLLLSKFLEKSSNPASQEIFKRVLTSEDESSVSFQAASSTDALLISGFSKSGSNSIVIGKSKSKNSSALIANDPHVGFSIPNLWLIGAYHSPSFNAVGLMFPGFPFILLGRNQNIAWGGTNAWVLTTSLYDASKEPLHSRKRTIRRRWIWDKEIEVRESTYGPVISDAPFLKDYKGPPVAMKWVGHEVSDEFTAFLNVNRAKTWDDFRKAFADYAVSGQNFLYADVDGSIGQLVAVRSPIGATSKPQELIHDPSDPGSKWQGYRNSLDLPVSFNPEKGFLVSANNKAAEANPTLALFYASNDRFLRLTQLLQSSSAVGTDDLKHFQMDIYSEASFRMSKILAAKLSTFFQNISLEEKQKAFLLSITSWDGSYGIDSHGAYAFELLRAALMKNYYTARYGKDIAETLAKSLMLHGFLEKDLEQIETDDLLQSSLKEAFLESADNFDPEKHWGDIHLLELKSQLSRVPFIGSRFVFDRIPVPGSSSTVMKTAHEITTDAHTTHYGAVARHISDLSNQDANYFVLLGGEDGWLGSAQMLDQSALWQKGEYVQVPLNPETAKRQAVIKMTLAKK